MNRHFTKEEINIAKEYTRKCSTSPVIKLRQIRATMTFSARFLSKDVKAW